MNDEELTPGQVVLLAQLAILRSAARRNARSGNPAKRDAGRRVLASVAVQEAKVRKSGR